MMSASRLPALLAFVALLSLSPCVAPAQSIDVSLNVSYANPDSTQSGGTWQLVAKSSHQGIAGLSLDLTGVAPEINNIAPRGIVNGDDPAGISELQNFGAGANRTVFIGQISLTALGPGDEQTLFYGIGSLANGAPNYPGRPMGSNAIGPEFDSLTNVQNVPWGTGDAFLGDTNWSIAVPLISGTFDQGVTPAFAASPASTGSVFTSVGTSSSVGELATVTLNTIVRTNFTGGLPGDFNSDGVVDAADYTVWRDNLGPIFTPGHFDEWKQNFGAGGGAGSGAAATGAVAIPEPASWILLLISTVFLHRRR